MDKMREEFEAWAKQRWIKPKLNKYESGYENATINEQWQAWQASRKALVVELPVAWEEGCGLVMSAYRVELALESAGVACK